MALALGHGRNSSWDPMKVRAAVFFGGILVPEPKEFPCVIGNFGGKV